MITPAAARDILRARAEALARPPVNRRASAAERQFVVFRLGSQQFALPLAGIREVEPHQRITPVPCTPAWVRGLINVRGEVLAVLDLGAFFGIGREFESEKDRVILVEAGGMTVGILTDEVLGTRAFAADDLTGPLPSSGGLRVEYVQGITPDGATVLDVEQLFSDERLVVKDETEL